MSMFMHLIGESEGDKAISRVYRRVIKRGETLFFEAYSNLEAQAFLSSAKYFVSPSLYFSYITRELSFLNKIFNFVYGIMEIRWNSKVLWNLNKNKILKKHDS